MILSHDQLETFAEDGLLTLKGGLPDDVWQPLADRVRCALTSAGLGDPNVLDGEFKHRRKRATRALKPHLNAVYTEELNGCASQLMADDAVGSARGLAADDPGRSEPRWGPSRNGRFPDRFGIRTPPGSAGPGYRASSHSASSAKFVAGGGGTLFVAGSHRLLDAPGRELRSKAFKKALRKKPYFNVLLGEDNAERARYLAEAHRVDGIDLRVVELTGEPGDVVLADARLLHAPAPNAQSTPRLMVRGFYIGRPLAEHYSALWPDYRASSPPASA